MAIDFIRNGYTWYKSYGGGSYSLQNEELKFYTIGSSCTFKNNQLVDLTDRTTLHIVGRYQGYTTTKFSIYFVNENGTIISDVYNSSTAPNTWIDVDATLNVFLSTGKGYLLVSMPGYAGEGAHFSSTLIATTLSLH